MPEPRASRPSHPEGYWRQRPLPWAWARKRLEESRNYWVASTTAEGTPHSRPVWGIWLEERFLFDTGSRIGTHLMARSDVTIHLESGDEVVIVEGTAERLRDPEALQRFLTAYNPKYNAAHTEPPGAVLAVIPSRAYGWVSDPTFSDAGAIFGSTGTRWDFDQPS
jgi:hypothetical protein